MANNLSGWRRFTSRLRPATKLDVILLEQKLMAKVSELGGILNAVSDNVDKIRTEVQALKDSIGNSDVELPPEAQSALDRLTAAVQAIDDINPDQPT